MSKSKTPTAIVEGPMGLRMPETTARRIEELAKDLPADFTYRRMAKTPSEPPRFDIDDQGFKTDVSLITTDDVDRDNEVVQPDGADLTDFRKSPTVFYNHDYDKPIGKARYVDQVKNGLRAMTCYAKRPDPWDGPWLPDAAHSMAKDGIATGKSIGFMPLDMRDPTPEDLRLRPDWKNATNIITRWIMLEYSVAPLPANQNALVQAVSKGIVDRAAIKLFGIELPEEREIIRPKRTMIFIPAPKSITIPPEHPIQRPPTEQAMHMNPNYQALDFRPTKEMQKSFKEGLDRHENGESKGHATPEMLAMAKHCSMGGDTSPEFCRKCKAFHDGNPNHLAAKPGTPALCLAMLHGGHEGKAFFDSRCKAMDLADSAPGPGPDTALDENGGTPSMKDGANENDSSSGGFTTAEQMNSMPTCKSCGTNENVTMKEAEGKKSYTCAMCGKSVDVNDNGNASDIATADDPGSALPGGGKPPMKAAKSIPLTEAQMMEMAEKEIAAMLPSLQEKAIELANEKILVDLGIMV